MLANSPIWESSLLLPNQMAIFNDKLNYDSIMTTLVVSSVSQDVWVHPTLLQDSDTIQYGYNGNLAPSYNNNASLAMKVVVLPFFEKDNEHVHEVTYIIVAVVM